jgi:hypothetical protein
VNGIVWLASYPKSGNTWLRLALQSLQGNDAALDINEAEDRAGAAAGRRSFDEALGVESSDLSDAEVLVARPRAYEAMVRQLRAPLPLKVHDAWRRTPTGEPLFPPTATTGVVYVVRDPRDVAASFAHHFDCSIDTAIDRMADAEFMLSRGKAGVRFQFPQRLRTWSQHVDSWLAAPDVRLLVVRYESMIADMHAVLTSVAQFIGLDAPPETLTNAVRAVRFDRLRAQEETQGFVEANPGSKAFFRRGVAGGWRDELTADQAARIVRDHGTVMQRLGYLER